MPRTTALGAASAVRQQYRMWIRIQWGRVVTQILLRWKAEANSNARNEMRRQQRLRQTGQKRRITQAWECTGRAEAQERWRYFTLWVLRVSHLVWAVVQRNAGARRAPAAAVASQGLRESDQSADHRHAEEEEESVSSRSCGSRPSSWLKGMAPPLSGSDAAPLTGHAAASPVASW